MSFKLLIHSIRFIFDLVFLAILLLLIFYSWFRMASKKFLKIKPSVLVSPLGSPMAYYMVKAIRTQGYKADNVAYECHPYFRATSHGLILADHYILRIINYLTDYTALFIWAILKYDLFEFPFSGGMLMNSHLRKLELPLLKICAKKTAVYAYGSDCTILTKVRNAGYKYNLAMDQTEESQSWREATVRANVKRVQKYADTIIAAADSIYLGKKAIMLPLAIDLQFWQASPPRNSKIVTIVHSTNHRSYKGTRFIIDIIKERQKKLPIKMLIIEKKTILQCRKLYPEGDIFIPDVIAGWHGTTTIEAMAIGRPVIVYLREDIAKFHRYYAKSIPAVSANPDTLTREITRLVRNKKLRLKLGRQGREYVEKYHSFEFVGALRNIIYEYIWAGKRIDQKIFEEEIKKRKLI